MARSREHLIDAATAIAGREDRLTEIFATVLDETDELAHAFLELVGLPRCHRYEVSTQERIPGGRPDMVVRGFGSSEAVEAVLWSEHKVNAGFGELQRERYRDALASQPGRQKRLIVISPQPASDPDDGWTSLTWQQIGELADAVGVGWGGDDWRQKAFDRETPVRWRFVEELLWYLEEKEGLAMTRGLSAAYVEAYRLAGEAYESVRALHERAAREIPGAEISEAGTDDEEGLVMWQTFESSDDHWIRLRLEDGSAWPEFAVSDRNYWSADNQDQPAFGVGVTCRPELHARLSADREWVRRLDEAGFCCSLWGYVRIWRSLPARAVLDFGSAPSDQARGLAAWAAQAFTDLAALDPGPLP